MKDNSELTEFNTGGSHEANPNGGIPQGTGANGKPNTVEEGETKIKIGGQSYVFSAKLSIKKGHIKRFNLPKYIAGKSFAEASKLIEKRFEDRNDNASLSTKEAFMSRAAESQEYTKLEMEANDMDMSVEELIAYKEEQAAAQAQEQAAQAQQQGQSPEGQAPEEQEQAPEGMEPSMAPTGEPQMGNQFAAGGPLNPVTGKPYQNLIPGFPYQALQEVPKTDSVSPTMDVSKFLGERKEGEPMRTSFNALDFLNSKKKGDPEVRSAYDMNNFSDIAPTAEFNFDLKGTTAGVDTFGENVTDLRDRRKEAFDAAAAKKKAEEEMLKGTDDLTKSFTKKASSLTGLTGNDRDTAAGDGGDDEDDKWAKWKQMGALAMSAAPFLGNLAESNKLEKPDQNDLVRTGRTYIPNFADERSRLNVVDEAYSGSEDAIANATAGNVGAYRANLLGSNINKGQAKAQAYSETNEINRQEQANLNEDFANSVKEDVSLTNLERDLDKQDMAAYDAAKGDYRKAAYEGLGELGEMIFKTNQMKDMTTYDAWTADKKKSKNTKK